MALGETHVDLFGDPSQAGADQDTGQIQKHFRGFQVIRRLPFEQARHIGHLRIMEQQQRFARYAIANKTLAHRA